MVAPEAQPLLQRAGFHRHQHHQHPHSVQQLGSVNGSGPLAMFLMGTLPQDFLGKPLRTSRPKGHCGRQGIFPILRSDSLSDGGLVNNILPCLPFSIRREAGQEGWPGSHSPAQQLPGSLACAIAPEICQAHQGSQHPPRHCSRSEIW